MTRYRSAFAVPSGFAVATRTATKGKSSAAPDAAIRKGAPSATTVAAYGRPSHVVAAPVRAA